MNHKAANSSVFSMLVILLVMAGILYFFWQSQQKLAIEEEPSVEVEIEETVVTE